MIRSIFFSSSLWVWILILLWNDEYTTRDNKVCALNPTLFLRIMCSNRISYAGSVRGKKKKRIQLEFAAQSLQGREIFARLRISLRCERRADKNRRDDVTQPTVIVYSACQYYPSRFSVMCVYVEYINALQPHNNQCAVL